LTHPLKIAVAVLAQKRNQTEMKLEECKLTWCFDLHWFEPSQVKKIVQAALEAGFLKENDRGLEVTFPVDSVKVPTGFKPQIDDLLNLPTQTQPLFSQIIAELESSTGISRQDLIRRVNHSQKGHRLTDIEVEGLLVGAQMGIDLTHFHDPVARLLRQRYVGHSTSLTG